MRQPRTEKVVLMGFHIGDLRYIHGFGGLGSSKGQPRASTVGSWLIHLKRFSHILTLFNVSKGQPDSCKYVHFIVDI